MKTNKHQVFINLFAILLSSTTAYFLFSSHSSISISKKAPNPGIDISVKSTINCTSNTLPATGYKFIQPGLFGKTKNKPANLSVLKTWIQNYINDSKSSGQIIETSVFYRDLSNDDWFSCNPDVAYYPGNLSHVPLLLSLLHQSESAPGFLDTKIKCTQKPLCKLAGNFGDRSTISYRKIYSLRDLLQRMFIDNDNCSAELLKNNIDPEIYQQTFSDLGLQQPAGTNNNFTLNAPDFSRFLWVLYKGTYLTADLSEYACSLMSKKESFVGIRKDLPAATSIVRSSGQWSDLNTGEYQLHESAVIYVTGKPYLLTIMTKGKNKDLLPSIISSISYKIYENIQKPA